MARGNHNSEKANAMPLPADSPPMGQREKNKLDKLHRIETAARELFLTKGYDETTTREIALRAEVGMGTIFIYADNKRDLLFLIATKDLEAVGEAAEISISKSSSLMTNWLAIFGEHYRYFVQQPKLSRLMLREMVFYDSGQQARKFNLTRSKIISLACFATKLAFEGKEIRSSEDHQFIGWIAFCIYQVELRQWLAGDTPNLKIGLAHLERALRVLVDGLNSRHPKRSKSPRTKSLKHG